MWSFAKDGLAECYNLAVFIKFIVFYVQISAYILEPNCVFWMSVSVLVHEHKAIYSHKISRVD